MLKLCVCVIMYYVVCAVTIMAWCVSM